MELLTGAKLFRMCNFGNRLHVQVLNYTEHNLISEGFDKPSFAMDKKLTIHCNIRVHLNVKQSRAAQCPYLEMYFIHYKPLCNFFFNRKDSQVPRGIWYC